MIHPIKEIISRRKEGQKNGIYSICSAHELVIKAGMKRALAGGIPVLIEATANQVNQFGGYTGMKPVEFRDFVFGIANEAGFPESRIILGGDHLGPIIWKDEPGSQAMAKAEELVKLYVEAGFTKIHIDTSMHLADDDKSIKLSPGTIAERGARLVLAAEEAFSSLSEHDPEAIHPVYVIGSEVPVPGGTSDDEGLQVTKTEDFEETVCLYRKAFREKGIEDAFRHIVAVVVQPGVEFGSEGIHHYNRDEARKLCETLSKYPDLVFEGHSTDYQKKEALKQMVEDGIAILKVGPALTFSLREGLFMLSEIEKELLHGFPEKQSYFIEVLDSVMLENPASWESYYNGSAEKIRLFRKYGLSDRSRYYLSHPRVKEAVNKLLDNLNGIEIPMPLVSQYMPLQFQRAINGTVNITPEELLLDKIGCTMDDYIYAILG